MASAYTKLSRMPVQVPPGPKGRLLVGSLLELGTDWLGFLTKCAREYGDVVYFRFAHVPIVLLKHPDHIEQVLVSKASSFSKSRGYRALERIVGKGLLTGEGEEWRQQRKLIQPAFRHNCLVPYAQAMVEAADRVLHGWHDGDVRDIHGDMMRATLDIVARTLLGCDASNEARTVGAALEVVAEKFLEQASLAFLIPASFPLPSRLSLQRAVRRLDKIICEIIRARRALAESKADLLDTLLRAKDQDARQMSDVQLRDELKTLFLAGHETTAIALSWTIYLLAQNPEVDAQLAEELQRVLGNRAPGFDDVARLHYTDMVIKESMRLYPPAWGMSRQANQAVQVAGYELAAGTTVFLVPWITHRDPRYFYDAERFDPNRWRDDPIRTGKIPRFAYFPFGGGPRVCVGAAFAMLEATLLLARIAQRFRFATGQLAEIRATATLRPKQGVRVVLRERHRAA